jgi:hypothetical protein
VSNVNDFVADDAIVNEVYRKLMGEENQFKRMSKSDVQTFSMGASGMKFHEHKTRPTISPIKCTGNPCPICSESFFKERRDE